MLTMKRLVRLPAPSRHWWPSPRSPRSSRRRRRRTPGVAHLRRRSRQHALRAARSDQSRDNFSTLEVAWRFKTDNLGPRPEFNFQSTPLMVGGVLYTTAGTRRAVVALDAATGEMLWMHSEDEGTRGQEAPRSSRAAVSPTGPTAAAHASSTSRPATG